MFSSTTIDIICVEKIYEKLIPSQKTFYIFGYIYIYKKL